jgi:hypothetical protein
MQQQMTAQEVLERLQQLEEQLQQYINATIELQKEVVYLQGILEQLQEREKKRNKRNTLYR